MNQKIPKRLKNSDSDYKAQDEGSASDNPSWRKYKKTNHNLNLKLTKKQIIENSIKTLLPYGTNLKYETKLNNEQYEQLLNSNQVEEISINFKCMLAKVGEIIDGENFKVVLFSNGKLVKTVLRLNGISTPQIKKTESKDFGTYVKKVLKSMIEGKIVRVQTGEYDKSGHILSRVYAFTASPLNTILSQNKNCSQFCINDYLIQHDMAKIYHSKNRGQFNKKSFQQFCDKYETKVWPVVENYPLEYVKEPQSVDYDEKQEEDDQ